MQKFAIQTARKIVVAVVGFTVVLFGVALIFLPGPAFVVIPAGLAILAIEFTWARRWLNKFKESGHQAAGWLRRTRNARSKSDAGAAPPDQPHEK